MAEVRKLVADLKLFKENLTDLDRESLDALHTVIEQHAQSVAPPNRCQAKK